MKKNKNQQQNKKKKNPLDILLNQRITDRTFKLIFFSAAGTVVGSVAFLLLQIQTLRESYESIASQKSVTVLDESGNVFNKRLYETNEDIATIFGITYIKKTLGYGYLNYNRILNFIKTFSTREVTDAFKARVSTDIKQLKVLNGTKVAKLNRYILENKNNSNKEFVLQAKVTQVLISESKHTSNLYYVRLILKFSEPTPLNSSGLFVTKFEMEQYNEEKHAAIFGED
jgi:hypothetical protein